MIKRLVMVALGVLPVALTSPVAVASVWSKPVTLQARVDSRAAAVDVAGGHTIVAWEGNTGVWAAIGRSNGRFVEQQLTRVPISNVATRLLVANSRGDAVIAWETRASPRPDKPGLPPGTLFVAYRPAGGRFGPPHRVARDTEGADVGIDGRGDVTIAWRPAATDSRPAALYVVRRLRGGRYGPARRVVSGPVVAFSLALNGAGDGALVWEQGSVAVPALLCETSGPGGTFGQPVTLVSDQQGAGPFDTGIDAGGRVTVAWEGPFDGASIGIPYAGVNVTTVGPGAVTAGPTQPLQDPDTAPLGDAYVRLVVDQHGDAAAVWDVATSATDTTPRIVVARRSGQGPFGPAQVLGTGDISSLFDAAIGPSGALAIAWQSHYRIKASLASGPMSALQGPTIVSPPRQGGAAPVVAVSASGEARILWQGGPNQPQPGGSGASPLLLATGR